jgi:hypothetical protein
MNTVYSVYTKLLNNEVHYFVKRFLSFPELPGVPDVLEGFGMHKDFNEACRLANVTDDVACQQIFDQLQNTREETKVIPLNADIDRSSSQAAG